MRTIFKIFVVVLLIFGSLVLSLDLVSERLIANNKSVVERLISEELEARVEFDTARLTILPRPELLLSGVSISRNNPGEAGFVRILAPLFRAHFELRPLLSRQLSIDEFAIERGAVEHLAQSGGVLEKLEGITLSGSLSQSERGMLLRGSKAIYSGIPIEIAEIEINFESRSLAIRGLSLGLSSGSLQGDFTVDLANYAGQAQVKATAIDLVKLRNTFAGSAMGAQIASHLSQLSSGVLSTDLKLFRSADNQNSFSGRLEVRDLVSKQMGLRCGTFTLNDLMGAATADGRYKISAGARVRNFAFDVSSVERYGLQDGTTNLSFNYRPDKTFEAQGRVKVSKFKFQDSSTELQDVDAQFNEISVKKSKTGDVVYSTIVEGSSLRLKSGDFVINELTKLSSKLSGTIPARGGYSISGPVAVVGANMALGARKIERVSGSVDMLLSGALKRFGTKDLSGSFVGQPFKVSTGFSITEKDYAAQAALISACGGTLSGSFSMQRGVANEMKTSSDGSNLAANCLSEIIAGSTMSPIEGVVRSIKLEGSGDKRDILKTFAGKGLLRMQDGIIRDIGFDAAFAKLLNAVPLIGPQILSAASERPGTGLRRTQGRVDTFNADFTAAKGRITSQNLKLVGRLSTVEAAGGYEIGGELDLKGSVVFLERTARSLAGPVTPLKGLFGELGKIEIPFTVTGPVSAPVVRGDVRGTFGVTAPGRAVRSVVSGVADGAESAIGRVGSFLFRSATPTASSLGPESSQFSDVTQSKVVLGTAVPSPSPTQPPKRR